MISTNRAKIVCIVMVCFGVWSCQSNEETKRVLPNIPEMVQLPNGLWMSKYEITQEQWQKVMSDNPSTRQGVRLPVESLSYNQAVEFCQKLSAIEGRTEQTAYRLPTEDEWIYAAKAQGNTDSNLIAESSLDTVAWFDKNSGGHIHEVGLKKPNAYGLYDMLGNVSEFVAFQTSGQIVMKGGSYSEPSSMCQIQQRNTLESRAMTERFSFFTGFRIVQSTR